MKSFYECVEKNKFGLVLSALPLLAFVETGFVRWEISLW